MFLCRITSFRIFTTTVCLPKIPNESGSVLPDHGAAGKKTYIFQRRPNSVGEMSFHFYAKGTVAMYGGTADDVHEYLKMSASTAKSISQSLLQRGA